MANVHVIIWISLGMKYGEDVKLYGFKSFLHNLMALNKFEISQQSFYSNFSMKSFKNQRNQLNSEKWTMHFHRMTIGWNTSAVVFLLSSSRWYMYTKMIVKCITTHINSLSLCPTLSQILDDLMRIDRFKTFVQNSILKNVIPLKQYKIRSY